MGAAHKNRYVTVPPGDMWSSVYKYMTIEVKRVQESNAEKKAQNRRIISANLHSVCTSDGACGHRAVLGFIVTMGRY